MISCMARGDVCERDAVKPKSVIEPKSVVDAVSEFVDKHNSYHNLICEMYGVGDCGFVYLTFKIAEELVKFHTKPNECCVVGCVSLLKSYMSNGEFVHWSDYLKNAIDGSKDEALLYLLKVAGEKQNEN